MRAAAVITGLAFLAVPLVARFGHPGDYDASLRRGTQAGHERNTSAAGMMLGGFRTSLSDLMFIKTEHYLHSGVEYRPHVHADHGPSVAHGDEHAHEHGPDCDHDHDHEDVETVIPSPGRDFRGFIGWLERHVKPWRDPSLPHLLTDGTELLPWFRIMTLSDPAYIRGYSIGAWWLQSKNIDAALDFALEGIEKNPQAFEIYLTLGNIHMAMARRTRHDESASARAMAAAREAFERALELGLGQRPPDWNEDVADPRWGIYMENDLLAAARIAVIMESRHGDPERARVRAADLARRLGDDAILLRLSGENE